jgi:hypothetical protein
VTFGRVWSIFSVIDAGVVIPARLLQDAVMVMALPLPVAELVAVHLLVTIV